MSKAGFEEGQDIKGNTWVIEKWRYIGFKRWQMFDDIEVGTSEAKSTNGNQMSEST